MNFGGKIYSFINLVKDSGVALGDMPQERVAASRAPGVTPLGGDYALIKRDSKGKERLKGFPFAGKPWDR